MKCDECDNQAVSAEVSDKRTVKRFVCQEHASSFDPATHFEELDIKQCGHSQFEFCGPRCFGIVPIKEIKARKDEGNVSKASIGIRG